MDTAIVLQYIRIRMQELGFGTDYIIRLRHFVLQASEIRQTGGNEHLFVLVEQVSGVTIESTFGFFDLDSIQANELQYEHQGLITITNHSTGVCHVRMIQAIPKKEQPCQP